ncbi:DUF2884 family protein [Dyella nitratireducens]|uniref:DUF2884 family protein n=1 Tax=Dyella nitratireducens TaxID=1849580 RepID=A0ABQ1GU81_9GAMM|nr:DUF2884 family protein [Dyella nitratireducens]GGA50485.1 hypothetical protein GCM10010981_44800 [Dyella nitratireducens]GLQ42595.1 hypothetical protein GCM10007902_24450 [Dyella nitratireducens]
MCFNRLLVVGMLVLTAGSLHAQDLSQVCHATSSYDLTLQQGQLIFDRAQPAPTRVVVGSGTLQTDGQNVPLNAEDQDRLALFQRELLALVPRVKVVIHRGVDVAVQTVQQEADSLNLDAGTQAELQRRLATDAANLHQRVAASQSTHDWHGDAANQYANQIAGDIAPLIASAMGQQALSAAMSGDLQQAAALRDQASDLTTGFQARLQQRLQVLRPDIQALCPDIQRLAALQQGIRASHGRPLNLLQIEQ